MILPKISNQYLINNQYFDGNVIADTNINWLNISQNIQNFILNIWMQYVKWKQTWYSQPVPNDWRVGKEPVRRESIEPFLFHKLSNFYFMIALHVFRLLLQKSSWWRSAWAALLPCRNSYTYREIHDIFDRKMQLVANLAGHSNGYIQCFLTP